MCGDGKTEKQRIQAGVKAWRVVEGVMADRLISKILKARPLSHVLHRHACTERKPWYCPNYYNKGCMCVRELREETGVQKS